MSWVFYWVCSRLRAHENLTLITLMQASPAQLVAVARKLATCCRSRFGAAFGIVPRFCDHKAAATAGFAAGKTATGRAGEACISVISVFLRVVIGDKIAPTKVKAKQSD